MLPNDSLNSEGKPETPQVLEKQFVRDLQDKQTVLSIFLVRDKAVLTGKNGKSYISLILGDNSGTVDARIWDNVDQVSHLFQSGDMIRIKGLVQIFQNRKQVVIHRLEKALAEEYKMDDFISSAQRSPDEMLQQLLQLVNEMKDQNLRQLTIDVLTDPEIRPRMLKAPAAKTIHHAYLSGLLEHVLSICGLMKAIATHYSAQGIVLREDLLYFGAIFHDIGKIWELDIEQGISYTDKGKLLGHMILAVELVEKKASRILGFPEELKDLCKHIILSHHGKLEYGSPKTPMFLEAFIVAAVDDFDSKINTLDRFLKAERETGERWSRYHQLFDRYFFLRIPE